MIVLSMKNTSISIIQANEIDLSFTLFLSVRRCKYLKRHITWIYFFYIYIQQLIDIFNNCYYIDRIII